MRYIEIYEKFAEILLLDELLNSACSYFCEVTPISKEDGFFDCL
jgi:hypothetical protein